VNFYKSKVNFQVVCWEVPTVCANPLARSPGQVKLDSDK